MHLSQIVILGGFLTLSIGEPIPIKPRCDNHTEPPYPYSFGTSAGGPTAASSGSLVPINSAGTGRPVLSTNSAGGLIGLSGLLPSPSAQGQTNSSAPVIPLTNGGNPLSTGSASASFPFTSNATLSGTGLPTIATGSSIKYYYYWNSLSSGLSGTGSGPTASGGSVSAFPTGASGGIVIRSLTTGVSTATSPGPSGNVNSSGLIGTGIFISTVTSGTSGFLASSASALGSGPSGTGGISAAGSAPFGNITFSGLTDTAIGPAATGGPTVLGSGISGGLSTFLGGPGTGLSSIGASSGTVPFLKGTGFTQTGFPPFPTGSIIASEFPPFPTLSSGTGIGGTGRVTIISGTGGGGTGQSIISFPTNSPNIPKPPTTATTTATTTIEPSLLGSHGIIIPVSTGGIGSTGPALQVNVTSSGIVVPPHPYSVYSPSVTSLTGASPFVTGNSVILGPTPSLNLTSTSITYTSTLSGTGQSASGSVILVPSPTLSTLKLPIPSLVPPSGLLQDLDKISGLIPPQTFASILSIVSPFLNPGGPIQAASSTAIVVPLPSLNLTVSAVVPTTTSDGVTQATSAVTLAIPKAPSLSISGPLKDTSIVATLVPPPSLSVISSIPVIEPIPVNITSGIVVPTGAQSDSGLLGTSSSSFSITGGSSPSLATPTTFDTVTLSGETSTSVVVTATTSHDRKPYGWRWRNLASSDPSAYAGYGHRYGYHYD